MPKYNRKEIEKIILTGPIRAVYPDGRKTAIPSGTKALVVGLFTRNLKEFYTLLTPEIDTAVYVEVETVDSNSEEKIWGDKN